MSEAKGHVLVTGAAIRVGRVIALTLANAGWDVTIHYNTSRQQAETLAAEITAIGRKAFTAQANLENAAETERLITANQGPPLTALVNNASLFEHDSKDPSGTRHNAINNLAPRLLTEALRNQLPEASEGAVVHILDSTAAPETMKLYAASRAALRKDIPMLAKTCAPRLRINAVSPGQTLINARESQDHFQRLVEIAPLRRPSMPKDVAGGVLFLLENRSVTGQILNIDSGMHLFSV